MKACLLEATTNNYFSKEQYAGTATTYMSYNCYTNNAYDLYNKRPLRNISAGVISEFGLQIA